MPIKHYVPLAIACLLAIACGGAKIITIKQINRDGNSEYFVCEGGAAKVCHGEHAQELDPAGYQARVEVHAPPGGCANGVANLDIVLDGSDVKRVRYECAQPLLPAPDSAGSAGCAGGSPGPGTGLPPSVPAAGAGLPPSAPGPGTGLPPSTGGTGGAP